MAGESLCVRDDHCVVKVEPVFDSVAPIHATPTCCAGLVCAVATRHPHLQASKADHA